MALFIESALLFASNSFFLLDVQGTRRRDCPS
jgi:hypothetical protein